MIKAPTVHLLNPQTGQTHKTPKKRACYIAYISLLEYILVDFISSNKILKDSKNYLTCLL